MEFLEEERSSGRPVSNQTLMTRASQIAGGNGIEGFKASHGWLWRFNRRNYFIQALCYTVYNNIFIIYL